MQFYSAVYYSSMNMSDIYYIFVAHSGNIFKNHPITMHNSENNAIRLGLNFKVGKVVRH